MDVFLMSKMRMALNKFFLIFIFFFHWLILVTYLPRLPEFNIIVCSPNDVSQIDLSPNYLCQIDLSLINSNNPVWLTKCIHPSMHSSSTCILTSFLASLSSFNLQPHARMPSRHDHPASTTHAHAKAHCSPQPSDLLLHSNPMYAVLNVFPVWPELHTLSSPRISLSWKFQSHFF